MEPLYGRTASLIRLREFPYLYSIITHSTAIEGYSAITELENFIMFGNAIQHSVISHQPTVTCDCSM